MAQVRASLALVGAVSLGFGCERADLRGPSPASSELSTGVVPVGTLGRTPHYEMQVSMIEDCETSVIASPARLSHVGMEVMIRARGDLQIPANPYYALLIDSDDKVHEPTLQACTPELEAQLLAPGAAARGWISFEIPTEARGLRLIYLPRLTSGEPHELTFALGR